MANDKIVKRKEEEVAILVEKLKNAKSLITFDYQGLTVSKFENLRKTVHKAGCEVEVLKNNVSRRAIAMLGVEQLANEMVGPKALIFSQTEVIAPAKGIFEFAKVNPLVIHNGIVEGKFASRKSLEELATLPNYETLLTMLAAGMLGTVSQLAIGLNMIAEQKANV